MSNCRNKVLVQRIKTGRGIAINGGCQYIALGVVAQDKPCYRLLYNCTDRKMIEDVEDQEHFQLIYI